MVRSRLRLGLSDDDQTASYPYGHGRLGNGVGAAFFRARRRAYNLTMRVLVERLGELLEATGGAMDSKEFVRELSRRSNSSRSKEDWQHDSAMTRPGWRSPRTALIS